MTQLSLQPQLLVDFIAESEAPFACTNDATRQIFTPNPLQYGLMPFSTLLPPVTPPATEPDSDLERDDPEDEVIFASLPPVHSGLAAEHIRNGISQAWRSSDNHVPDAERAFFVADLSQILKQHERWQACLPGIEPFYAVKCNPDPYVLRLLAALGAGFDCASRGEISQVLEIGGIEPSRIIFANPCKADSFIRHAARSGVHKMTFDNMDELFKIARTHPSAELVLRILTDDSKSLCRLGLKFGAPLVTVPALLQKAKELGLNVIGVSFHVGSGCYDSSAFADAVMRSRLAFDMGRAAGYEFNFLDVGGGFEDGDFERTAATLDVALQKHFPNRDGLRIIAEPGRFYVSNAFTLAANIIARRAGSSQDTSATTRETEKDGDTQPSIMYYINDGVYGSFNCILFDHQKVHPYVLTNGRSFSPVTVATGTVTLEYSSVWGPTCDSIDCVSPLTTLPSNLEIGDWLGFENMGAYTICAASRFNGFDISRVHYTSGIGEDSVKVRRVLHRLAAAVGDDA